MTKQLLITERSSALLLQATGELAKDMRAMNAELAASLHDDEPLSACCSASITNSGFCTACWDNA